MAKIIVEAPINFINQAQYQQAGAELLSILNALTIAESDEYLKANMDALKGKLEHYIFGYGSSHLWVTQSYGGNKLERIIIVYF